MKKVIGRLIIWILIIAGLSAIRLGIAKAAISSYVVDFYQLNDDAYIAENMGNSGNVYLVTDETIKYVYSTSTIGRGVDVAEVYGTGDNAYVLVTTTIDESTAYNVIVLDDKLNEVSSLGWTILSQNGTVTDMEVYDSSIYLTQLSVDGRTIYIYDVSESNLSDGKVRISLFNKPSCTKWKVYDTLSSSETDVIYQDATLEDGTVTGTILQDSSSTPKEEAVSQGKTLLRKAKFTQDTFNGRFSECFHQMLIIFAVGALLIIFLPRLLKNRNRMSYLFLIWECILMLLLAFYWLGYDMFYRYATVPVLFIAGSILGGILFWFQGIDLRALSRGMRGIIDNKPELDKPKTFGQDMNFLWNGLVELGEKIKKINYSKYQLYEAYYRFSPKGMERLLMKDSMLDVTSEDEALVDTTVALIRGRLFSRNASDNGSNILPKKVVELISEYQENKKGVLISMSSDMYQALFMFTQDNHNTFQFGIEYQTIISNFRSRHHDGRNIILFHKAPMSYGIVGTKQQSCQYIYSQEISELEEKLYILEKLGVDFAMTKAAYDAEATKPATRYIGEMRLDKTGKDIELYQVLDAMTNAKRKLYLENQELFEKGIGLLKQKDFYLARNIFAEELRAIPEDGVARWYLFLCEKYLENPDEKISFMLN